MAEREPTMSGRTRVLLQDAVAAAVPDVPPDPPAADLDQVAAILAEYVYEAWRVGRYGQQSYEPMWHESSQPTMLEADRAAQALRAAGLLSSGRLVDAADLRTRVVLDFGHGITPAGFELLAKGLRDAGYDWIARQIDEQTARALDADTHEVAP